MKYVRRPTRRFDEWINALLLVREYSLELKKKLGRVTVILHGSYARGDFNMWSDIDLVIVSEKFRNTRILERYNLLPEPPPRIEPILLTPEEFINNLDKPSWRQMLSRGSIIVIDDYRLSNELSSRGIKASTINEALEHIHVLKEKYSV